MNTKQLDEFIALQIETREPNQGIDAMCQHASARRLVWWGCLCGWSVWRPEPPLNEDQSLAISSRWVFAPADDLRIAAGQRAETDQAGLCKFVLQAVKFSGGTLTLPDGPIAMPTPNVAGNFINGFVQTLLAQDKPVQRAQTVQVFLQLARQAISQPLPNNVGELTAVG